jgi:hypothetical protein
MDVKCPGCFNITTVFSHAQYEALGACYHKMHLQGSHVLTGFFHSFIVLTFI